MRSSSIALPLLLSLFLPAACAASPSQPTAPQTAEDSSPSAAPALEDDSSVAPGEEVSVPEGPHPLLDERQPDPSAALPELTYKHLGMHIGGESNSPASKRPWFDDIERHDDALLRCYRLVENPQRGGSYGVDLYVSKKGGAPEVRGSRQKIGGDDFDQCMKGAFSEIEFHQPERPTVFSYSILFQLGD